MGNKIVIIGSGYVGSTTAFTLLIQQVATDIWLIDTDRDKASADALDLMHGIPLTGHTKINAGDYSDCKEADIIIITAGVAQKPGESRLDLLHRNMSIMNQIMDQVEAFNKDAILLIVTNPVDVMTWVACNRSSRPNHLVIGSGTLLDSSRFRLMIGNELKVDPASVHASILGEHGDSQVPIWSKAQAGGLPVVFDEQTRKRLADQTRTAAYEIIAGKGATYYAVSLAVCRICNAILRDERAILEVSVMLTGQYGIKQICLGIPCVLGKEGIHKVMEFPLAETEHQALIASAVKLSEQLTIAGLVEGE